MTDFDDFNAKYRQQERLQAQANELNKAALFDALQPAGITVIVVNFDGEGDSGQCDSPMDDNGNEIAFPAAAVTIHNAGWNDSKLTTDRQDLKEAVETLCYGYLEQHHGGWENNDGAFGEFRIDVAARTITLEFHGRITSHETTEHSF